MMAGKFISNSPPPPVGWKDFHPLSQSLKDSNVVSDLKYPVCRQASVASAG